MIMILRVTLILDLPPLNNILDRLINIIIIVNLLERIRYHIFRTKDLKILPNMQVIYTLLVIIRVLK